MTPGIGRRRSPYWCTRPMTAAVVPNAFMGVSMRKGLVTSEDRRKRHEPGSALLRARRQAGLSSKKVS